MKHTPMITMRDSGAQKRAKKTPVKIVKESPPPKLLDKRDGAKSVYSPWENKERKVRVKMYSAEYDGIVRGDKVIYTLKSGEERECGLDKIVDDYIL